MSRTQRSLADAVHSVAGEPREAGRSSGRAPGRAGKKGILIYVEPEMARSLKRLAVDEDTTLQALGLEAFGTLIDHRQGRAARE